MQQDPAKKTDTEQLRRILTSAEGRQLLALLSRGNTQTLQNAAEAARQGDTARAQALMQPLLSDPQVQTLLARLNGQR